MLPRIGPLTLYGLLFTVAVLFALQGKTIASEPVDDVRIAASLLCYFAIMWTGSFALDRALKLSYERTTTRAFTAAGNNFELGIAVAIGVFGATSGQALAVVVGPLIEMPVLVALVYVALWANRRFTFAAAQGPEPRTASGAEPSIEEPHHDQHRNSAGCLRYRQDPAMRLLIIGGSDARHHGQAMRPEPRLQRPGDPGRRRRLPQLLYLRPPLPPFRRGAGCEGRLHRCFPDEDVSIY